MYPFFLHIRPFDKHGSLMSDLDGWTCFEEGPPRKERLRRLWKEEGCNQSIRRTHANARA